MASTVLPNGIIIPEKYSRDWYADLYHNWQELDNQLGGGTPKDGTLTIQKNGSTVGTFSANQATDETIDITVPDVNDATLTIQQNGTTVDTFTANSSSDKTVNISVPTKTSDLNNDSGYITGVAWNDVTDKPSFATVATSGSYNDLSNKPTIPTVNNGTLTIQQNGTNVQTFTANQATAATANIQCVDLTNNQTIRGNKDFADKINIGTLTVGGVIKKVDRNWYITLIGGNDTYTGGRVFVYGNEHLSTPGNVKLSPATSNTVYKDMILQPSGTWTWNGTACQITSDQRLKQQITEIDDKLLDAWGDVELVQFKYNESVDTKGKSARLHTGYVVQQINSACKSHGVDVSAYGLYCHEEYPQEVEEVEVEQEDGTKTKERKVIREASEHYSLRYTEVYAVECMYLRRCIARLTARIEELEKENNTK